MVLPFTHWLAVFLVSLVLLRRRFLCGRRSSTVLSPIDVYQLRGTVDCCFLYDQPLERDLLKGALSATLEQFPCVAGIIQPSSAASGLEISHGSPLPLDVLFSEETCDYAEHLGPARAQFSRALEGLMEHPQRSLFRSVLIHVNGHPSVKSILGVRFSHALVDAHSMFLFLTAWSGMASGSRVIRHPVVDHDRSKLVIERAETAAPDEQPLASRMQMQSNAASSSSGGIKKVQVAFTLHPQDIQRYKARASASGQSRRDLSTNDVLAAHVARLSILSRRRERSLYRESLADEGVIAIATNFRTRAQSLGIGESYFGCANTQIKVTVPTDPEDQSGFELGAIASKIRAAVEAFGPDDVRKVIFRGVSMAHLTSASFWHPIPKSVASPNAQNATPLANRLCCAPSTTGLASPCTSRQLSMQSRSASTFRFSAYRNGISTYSQVRPRTAACIACSPSPLH
jgi:hypothetical protein